MNCLTELKQITDSLNIKINDNDLDTLTRLLPVIGKQYGSISGIPTILKMLNSLTAYMNSRKTSAHADCVSVLASLGTCLSRLAASPDTDRATAEKLVSEQIRTYNVLKNKISSRPDLSPDDIQDFKAAILAIDWEISPGNLHNFKSAVSKLLSRLKEYKIHYNFLKIMYHTGQYIASEKADAHTDSIPFLQSVFENFEYLVQNPDTPLSRKKELVLADMKRFNEFKTRISRKKKPDIKHADDNDDISMPPALSHVRPDKASSAADDDPPVTRLSDDQDSYARDEDTQSLSDLVKPALAGRQPSSAESRDVMDDLFTMKESPADELLDEIHLLEVHGTDPAGALAQVQPEVPDTMQSDQIKKITPKRVEKDPIPEIGTTLDEFFNLEDSGNGKSDAGIVPFNYEDEESENRIPEIRPSEDIADKKHGPENGPDPAMLLTQLSSRIESMEWIQDKTVLGSIKDDISSLEKIWDRDDDKSALIKIISVLVNKAGEIRRVHATQTTPPTSPSEEKAHENPQPVHEGILAKIKKFFS